MLAKIIILLLLPLQLLASEVKIVAIAGDQVITNYDLEQRLRILSFSSGKKFEQEHLEAILEQIRESLIREKIQYIEASKYNILASDKEIETAFLKLADDNKISLDKFKRMIKEAGVSIAAFKENIAASLNWRNLLIHKVRPTVSVSDIEIEEYLQRLKKNANGYEYLAKIFEFPTSIENGKDIKRLTEKTYKKFKKKPLSLKQLEEELSFAHNNGNGDMVWKLINDFPEKLQNIIKNLDRKELSETCLLYTSDAADES